MSDVQPKVFLSYSHDSREHSTRVLELSNRLRKDGIEAELDQYVQGSPAGGWPSWMLDKLDWAEFVVIICTETYYRRFRKQEAPGKGSGATWEGHNITQEFYDSHAKSRKFVPVIFCPDHREYIPNPLRSGTHYVLDTDDNYQILLKLLRGQAGEIAPPVVPAPSAERRPADPLTFPPANRGRIAAESLHYLCDRGDQEDELIKVLEEQIRTSRRPAVCVIYGDAREQHGRFIDRIEGHSLPSRLRDFIKGGGIRFVRLNEPPFPKSVDRFPEHFRTQITKELDISECANHTELLGRLQALRVQLVGIVMEVSCREALSTGRAYFDLVRDFWAEAPDLPAGLHIVSFVSAMLEPVEQDGLVARFRAWLPGSEARQRARMNAKLRECIDQFEMPVGQAPKVVCRVLPELLPPKKEDVHRWAQRPDVSPQLLEPMSVERLNQIFGGRATLPMDDLLKPLNDLVKS